MTSSRSDVLTLQTADRRSTPLLFVEEGACLYVIPSGDASRWSSRALSDGHAEVRRPDGHSSECSVRVVVDEPVAERVRARFREKYGEEAWRRHFAGQSRVIVLGPWVESTPRSEMDLVEEEFDAIAPSYAATVQRKPFELYLKERSRSILRRRLHGLDPLLEIGPGSGFETIPLLAEGHRVVAVDLSKRMLAELRAGARALGVDQRLTSRIGRLGDLDSALAGLPMGSFAGAFSTFGAFNLEPELSNVPPALARQLRPGAPVLLVVLNRPGLVPSLGEVLAGNPAGALYRLGETVPAEVIRYPLAIHLVSVGRLGRMFAPWFRYVRCEALSVLAPPFDSPRLYRFLSPAGKRRLRRFDEALVRFPGSSALAEWLLVELVRRDSPAPPAPA